MPKSYFYPESADLCAIAPADSAIPGTVIASDHLVDPNNHAGIMLSFVLTLCDDPTHGKSLIYLGVYLPEHDAFQYIVHREAVTKGVLYACGMETIKKFWGTDCTQQVDFLHHYLNLTTGNLAYTLASRCIALNEQATEEIKTFFDNDFAFSQEKDNMAQAGIVIPLDLIGE